VWAGGQERIRSEFTPFPQTPKGRGRGYLGISRRRPEGGRVGKNEHRGEG